MPKHTDIQKKEKRRTPKNQKDPPPPLTTNKQYIPAIPIIKHFKKHWNFDTIVPDIQNKSSEETAQTISDRLSTLYNRPHTNPDLTTTDTPNHPPKHKLIYQLSPTRLGQLIYKTSTRKSTGPDGISVQLLKTAFAKLPRDFDTSPPRHKYDTKPKIQYDNPITRILSKFFNLCVKSGITPSQWQYSTITPLPKSDTPQSGLDYRPVTITQLLRRIFENTLMPYTYHHVTSAHFQSGFKPGYNIQTHALLIHTSLQLISDSLANVHLIQLDLAKAFDSVHIPTLIQKLIAKQLDPKYISIIQHLYTRNTSSIKHHGFTTQPFKRTRGILQGAPLAPILFNLYIDETLQKIAKKTIDLNTIPQFYASIPPVIAFADDITLITSTVDQAAQVGNFALAELDKIGQTLQPTKSTHMTSDQDAPTVQIDGKPLPRSNTVTIVGFDFTPMGIDIKSTLSRTIETTTAAYAKAQSLGMKPDLMHPRNIKHVFQAFVSSTLTYTTHIAALYLDSSAKSEYMYIHKQIDELFLKYRSENPKSDLPRWSDIVWNRVIALGDFFKKTAKYHPIRTIKQIRPERLQIFSNKRLNP